MATLLGHVGPQDIWTLSESYSGGKREKYRLATQRLLEGDLSKRDAGVSMFVKFEKLKFSPLKPNPDPRAIQFRNPKYCVAIAQYLKPIEHKLYAFKGRGAMFPTTKVIGKGLSARGRAQLLVKKWEAFESPVAVSIDASRFDKHVSVPLLQIEHSVYVRMAQSQELAKLLSWQLHNTCTSNKGLKYVTKGKRMSGDMNTALGNCLLMVVMVATFMQGKKYDMLDDGDDCLLIVESEDFNWVVENIGPEFLTYGMQVKVEGVARSLDEVEWCQANPIIDSSGVRKFVRNPARIMSRAIGGSKYFTSTGGRRKLINTIGMAELILNHGVPVLQEYALALMRNASTTQHLKFDSVDSLYYRIGRELKEFNLRKLEAIKPLPITDVARLSYARAFGVSPQRQLEQEKFLKQWSFSVEGVTELGGDIDKDTWAMPCPHTPELYGA